MIHCNYCNTDFKNQSAYVSHTKSRGHEHSAFKNKHQKFWMPVTPTEAQMLINRGLKEIIYGPRITTRPGWIRQREKTRENPWVKKSEVREVLFIGPALQALLRRAQ